MDKDFDIIIVGGGLAGASLACALGGSELRVAVIEAVPFGTPAQPSHAVPGGINVAGGGMPGAGDGRTVALNYGSRRIFAALGLWERIAALGACPIERIHISDRGRFGFTRLEAASMGVEALGYVVETRVLGQALQQALQGFANVRLIAPARLQQLTITEDSATVTLDAESGLGPLTARLVVGADGVHSAVRAAAGIGAETADYHQTAIVTTITPERPHGCTAYERFTASGPLALLPKTENRMAVVWSAHSKDADGLMALSDAEFLQGLQARFGNRLGRLAKLGKRQAYPLALTHAADHVRPRLALVGNAAHTVHPVAGQGFNLGLRDVAALAELLVQAARAGGDIGALSVLNEFAAWRQPDDRAVMRFTNGLVRTFSNDFTPLALARGLGLTLVDLAPPLKRALLRRTMGLSGRLPRLARGLSL